MHIIVVCPRCNTRYQLQPSMRGLKMRCQNPVCRQVFEVPASDPTPPPPGAGGPVQSGPAVSPTVKQVSGSVGDIVPILNAEAIGQGPAPTPSPPTANAGGAAGMVPLLPAEPVSPPQDAPSWRQAPPPVRSPGAPPARPDGAGTGSSRRADTEP